MKTVNTSTEKSVGVISDHVPFTTRGGLSARWYNQSKWAPAVGRLPKRYEDLLQQHCAQGDVYVVFSYNTPIAWWTETFGWINPQVKYSVTTSKHQGKCPAGTDPLVLEVSA